MSAVTGWQRRGRFDFSRQWEDDFLARSGAKPEGDACQIWQGTINHHGRPVLSIRDAGKGRKITASRYAYWLAYGEVQAGRVICHRCDTPTCVRADHLFAGTQAENLADMTAKGRRARCGVKGEAHHNATISDAEASAIHSRMLAGETAAAIAAGFGVHRTTVFRAAKRSAL